MGIGRWADLKDRRRLVGSVGGWGVGFRQFDSSGFLVRSCFVISFYYKMRKSNPKDLILNIL